MINPAARLRRELVAVSFDDIPDPSHVKLRGCKDISCTSELKILNDSLQIENRAKEREIRRLSKETQQYENTITCLRKELSQIRYHTPRDHRDAEVMVGMCCTGQDCVREIPIRESGTVDESPFSSPSSAGVSKLSMDNVRVLREHNVALSKQVSGLRQSCAALQIQNKTAIEYAQFRDEIIKEMRRQLKCHKNKLRHIKEDCRFCDIRSTATSQDSGSQPYRRRRPLSLQRCVVDTTKYNHGDEGDKAHGDGSVEE